jgi:hypothetical protein
MNHDIKYHVLFKVDSRVEPAVDLMSSGRGAGEERQWLGRELTVEC